MNAKSAAAGAAGAEGAAGRRLLLDVCVVGGYLALALFLALLSLEPSRATPLGYLLALTVAGTAVLALRRALPWAAFIGALALLPLTFLVGSGAEVVILIPLLYRAGLDGPAMTTWLRFGLAVFASLLAGFAFVARMRGDIPFLGLAREGTSDWFWDWMNPVIMIAAGALIATLIGVVVGNRRRLVAALVERADQLRRERDQQASIARAAERERIAREMHDVIAHSLAVIIALADGAQAAAPRRPEEAERAVARIGETGRRTLGEVQRLLAGVRGDDSSHTDAAAQQPGHPQPGFPELPALVEEFRAAGLPVRLELAGEPVTDRVLGFTVYRIAQESLTNVLRHSTGVRDVLVRIARTSGGIRILVEDAAEPAPAPENPGRGLTGIRERAAFYDGTVEAGPRRGGGWRVSVDLPARTEG